MLNNTLNENPCAIRKDANVLILLIIPFAALVINSVMVIAVYIYRSKLKQKSIYTYVYSTLSANLVFSLFAIYQIFNHYFQMEGNPATRNIEDSVARWWTFRKSFTACLFLVMVANIGALINAIQDGFNLLANTTSSSGRNRNKLLGTLKLQKKKSYVFVAMLWVFPTILSFTTLAGWNCAGQCKCLSQCYHNKTMPWTTKRCNRVWVPMSNSFMGFIVLLWLLEFILLFFQIYKTFRHSMTSQKEEASEVTAVAIITKPQLSVRHEPSNSNTGVVDDIISGGDVTKSEISAVSATKTGERSDRQFQKIKKRRRREIIWLADAAKQLFILTSIFFITTAPAMIAILVDIFSDGPLNSTVSSILSVLPILYCVISPFLLMKHLGGLKNAATHLIIRISNIQLKRRSRISKSQQTSKMW